MSYMLSVLKCFTYLVSLFVLFALHLYFKLNSKNSYMEKFVFNQRRSWTHLNIYDEIYDGILKKVPS